MVTASAGITAKGLQELRSRIGVDLRVSYHNRVATRGNIRKFVGSIGDGNPLYTDLSYATSTRYCGVIAPPTFLYSVVSPTGALAGGLPGVHSLHGGNEWEFFLPIRDNDVISVKAQLTNVAEKPSRFAGRSVLVEVAATYTNQQDRVIARARGWSFRVEREAATRLGTYGSIQPHRYTAKEAQAVEEASLNEKPFGSAVRYWDDVKEGQVLDPRVKGPLTMEDMQTFIATASGDLPHHKHWELYRKHPAFFYRDPGTNAPEPWSRVNIYDYAAQMVGIPRAHDLGSQRIAWLGHMLTDWMGDDGFLEKLNVRLLLPNLMGDTQWSKGEVTRKFLEGEASKVECSIWCENQQGDVTARGTAVIRLLSKRVTPYPPVKESTKPGAGSH